MTNEELKKLPIQFQRVEPGVYVSTDGRWRIHRTEHTGRMCGQSRVRWWTTDTVKNRPFMREFAASRYEMSLADAIESLHRGIGRGIKEAFDVLRDMRLEQQRQENARQERLRRIDDLAARIMAFVVAHGPIADAAKAAELAAHLHEDGAR